MTAARAGAVTYAKDPVRVAAFYEGTAARRPVGAADDHIAPTSDVLEPFVVRIPPAIAVSIVITTPPDRRGDTPIELVLAVSALAAARAAAAEHGGGLDPAEREWAFGQWRVCDGFDPEANVVQFHQPA